MIKPINLEALSKWVGHIPQDVVDDMAEIAPMLAKVGYDPNANPPNYGKPDSFVLEKMSEIERDRDNWKAAEERAKDIRERLRKELTGNNAHTKNADS